MPCLHARRREGETDPGRKHRIKADLARRIQSFFRFFEDAKKKHLIQETAAFLDLPPVTNGTPQSGCGTYISPGPFLLGVCISDTPSHPSGNRA